jgi:hypothetical protein
MPNRRPLDSVRRPSEIGLVSTQACDPGAYKERTRKQWQLLAGLSDDGRAAAWRAIEMELGRPEGSDGFEASCELNIAARRR